MNPGLGNFQRFPLQPTRVGYNQTIFFHLILSEDKNNIRKETKKKIIGIVLSPFPSFSLHRYPRTSLAFFLLFLKTFNNMLYLTSVYHNCLQRRNIIISTDHKRRVLSNSFVLPFNFIFLFCQHFSILNRNIDVLFFLFWFFPFEISAILFYI